MAVEMNRPYSANGNKPQPTRGTDLDTKWEKKSRPIERNMDMNCRKRA